MPHSVASFSFAAILEPDDGAFRVLVPAFPALHTFGQTPAEALALARQAIDLSIEVRRSRSEPLPPSYGDAVRLERISITLPAT